MLSYFAVNQDDLCDGNYYKLVRDAHGRIRQISRFFRGEFRGFVWDMPNDLYYFPAQRAEKLIPRSQESGAN